MDGQMTPRTTMAWPAPGREAEGQPGGGSVMAPVPRRPRRRILIGAAIIGAVVMGAGLFVAGRVSQQGSIDAARSERDEAKVEVRRISDRLDDQDAEVEELTSRLGDARSCLSALDEAGVAFTAWEGLFDFMAGLGPESLDPATPAGADAEAEAMSRVDHVYAAHDDMLRHAGRCEEAVDGS